MTPVLSRIFDFNRAILITSVKRAVFEHVHFVHAAKLAMVKLEYIASLDLIVSPSSEQTLGVVAPF